MKPPVETALGEARRRRPSLLAAFGAMAVFFGGQLIVAAAALLFGASPASLPMLVLGMLAGGIAATEFTLWTLARSGLRPRDIGFRAPRLVADLALGTVTAVLALALALVAVTVIACEALGVPRSLFQQPELSRGLIPDSPSETALVVLLAVVFAPVFEEIVFRGYLFAALTARAGAMASVVLTSLLFGAVHIEGVLPIVILGVAYAVVRAATGRLLPAIVAHALTNVAAVSVLIATAT